MNKHCAFWKRTVSAVLALAMVAPMFPAGDGFARAAETGEEAEEQSTGATELRAQYASRERLDELRYYDDRMDVSGCEVEIVEAGVPASYQVGYGVAENAVRDTAVVTLEGDTLIASGIGRAKVRIDGAVYDVEVTAAPISLLLLIGQSNMQGSEGDENQSIVCPDGMVYATYGDRYTMTTSNATNFAPSALTGTGRALNVNGTATNLEDWPVYLLNEAGAGKAGPDSGFAYEWVKQTGEKVWVVNAAHGGSSITTWQDGGANYEECVLLFKACQQTLQKEIAAGHYTLSHTGYFWCQGCTDYSRTAEWYVEKYLAMHEDLKTELAFDEDTTFEFGGIIPVRAGHENYTSYRQGVYTDTTTAKYHESFKDLRFTGPRVAQYWMTSNPDLEDIWNVCDIGEDWVTMPDGTDGVAEYFASRYPEGTVDYTTQVKQKDSWYTPTTPAAVHDSIHYNQIGYNEVGREAARNALIMLGEMETPEVECSVAFLTWDGYTKAEEISAFTAASSATLVVPKVYPVWKSKEVTYQLSEGLSWNYYDLLADSARTCGTLSAGTGESVSVVEQEPGAFFVAHLSALPEVLCRGVNLWSVLEHDKYYFANGTGWGIHSSGKVYSVTIPVSAGEKIHATSFGAAPGNGQGSTNGIRVTFFDGYGVLKSIEPAEVYREFSANGGYLIVPQGAAAINVPMWNNDDTNELYILSRGHDADDGICGICGKDGHVHAWSGWETVQLPSASALGIEERSCACGQTERRNVEGVWQKYALGDHLAQLPEALCSGVNLWSVLEHDKYYFANGIDWGIHSSGKVYSVTIPVEEGEKIAASSFGARSTNGGSSNGIRVTFFDAYGILKSMEPAEVYAEFAANGCLTAPAGSVAVNIPMWTNSDKWEARLPERRHSYKGGICTICGERSVTGLAGKKLSVLGASISTYDGVSSGEAAKTTNSTIASNAVYYTVGRWGVALEDTWWMRTANDLGLELLVNNAWSGSAIFLTRSGTVGAYVDRCVQLHDNTGENAGEEPDIICIQMGFNDFSYGKSTLGTAEIDYDVLITANGYGVPATTMEATAIMLDKITKRYPEAEVYMFNHFKRVGQGAADTALMEQLNADIEIVCKRFGVGVVDLYNTMTTAEYIADGRLHPNALGMDAISEAVKSAILEEHSEETAYPVTLQLDHVSADCVTEQRIPAGCSVALELRPAAGEELSVAVFMDGKDITASAYQNGAVTIAAVKGPVVIAAKSIHTPRSYRWEFDGEDLASAAYGDITANALTKNAGTTSGGVFSTTRYGLERTVILRHDNPWVVEWRSSGDMKNTSGSGARIFTSTDVNAEYNARYVFKSATRYLIAMGEKTTTGSHNYGIALADYGIDGSEVHTYRLENRIAADGGNMVYLLVDGTEIGPMNHYYIGTADQKTTSDWLSGKDFAFPYIGTDTHGLNRCCVEYLAVWEGGHAHTYENGICIECGEEHPELDNYSGKVISILGDSISTFAGYIPAADGFNLEHLARYPQDDLLTDVNETWWMQIIHALDAKLGINDSWRGATVSGAAAVTSGVAGEKAAMSNLQRIRNLGANGTPDVILFYGGTNDIAHVSKIGSFDPASAPAQVDLTAAKWDNLAEGYVHTLLRLKHHYPDAKIVALLPTYTKTYYSDAKLAQANAVMAAICEHYGVPYVDLRHCGITTDELPDGIHPDARGMDLISEAAVEVLLQTCDIEAGENTVCSVMHDVKGVTASLGYYKGISEGRTFEETLTAETNMEVTVTMGDVDITADCYAGGKIFIPAVTGDLVITAKARFSLGEHLRQLPEDAYAETNLWKALGPETGYFMGAEWVNNYSSITFPVKTGDRVWANAFGKAGENGGTRNGIRVTFFGEEGMVKTMTPDETYAEFSAKGYVEAPGEATAVNVVLWKNDAESEVRLLTLPHGIHNYAPVVTCSTCIEQGYTTYTCTICTKSYVGDYTPARGHSEEVDAAVASTCTQSGLSEGKHCTDCGTVTVKQENIPALGHKWDAGVKDGRENIFTCLRCGEIKRVQRPGNPVSGTVKSSKPSSTLKVTLQEEDTTVYEDYFTGETGGTEQDFVFDSVASGTYDVVIRKEGHLSCTVKNVTVDDEAVVLPAVELVAGDLDGDDKINLSDLVEFRMDFGKSGADVANEYSDMDGDSKVNLSDLVIFRSGFGKSAKDCVVDYSA